MSMFSFQAIHNLHTHRFSNVMLFIDYVNVLFSSNSQQDGTHSLRVSGCLSIMSMFSFQAIHNSGKPISKPCVVVYRLCQCSLFKQFTTNRSGTQYHSWLFIDYVNVLFSSNSQLRAGLLTEVVSCLSIMSMFSFQAIHNLFGWIYDCVALFIDYVNVLFSSNSQRATCGRCLRIVVYRLCQCSLFKQFTTQKR